MYYAPLVAKIRFVASGCKWKKLSDITGSSLERYISTLSRRAAKGDKPAATGGTVSPRTRNQYVYAMKSFCRWLVFERKLPINPVDHVRILPTDGDRRHDHAAYTPEALAALIEAARVGEVHSGLTGAQRALVYRLAAFTGLRVGELAALTPQRFDLDSQQPTVTVHGQTAKNRKTEVLPLHPSLTPLVKKYLEGMEKTELLFPGGWHGHAARMIRRDLTAAGEPWKDATGLFYDFHALRHTYCTALGRSNAPLADQKKLMRHSDVRLTMRYSHSTLTDQAKALAALPELPAPPATKPTTGLHS